MGLEDVEILPPDRGERRSSNLFEIVKKNQDALILLLLVALFIENPWGGYGWLALLLFALGFAGWKIFKFNLITNLKAE